MICKQCGMPSLQEGVFNQMKNKLRVKLRQWLGITQIEEAIGLARRVEISRGENGMRTSPAITTKYDVLLKESRQTDCKPYVGDL